MADVNLAVEVTSLGVTSAISSLKDLRSTGITTGSALRDLAAQSAQTQRSIATVSAAAVADGNSLTGVSKASKLLRTELSALEKGYSDATLKTNALTAADRLLAGGGTAVAEQIRALREAQNPDAVRDMVAVEQQEAEVERQRLALIEQTAAAQARLNDALSSKAAGTLSLGRANEDLANQAAGITNVEKAEINLTRATEDLNAATAARKATPIAVQTAEQVNARASALENEANATRAVIAAQEQLTRAQEQGNQVASAAGSGTQNAFQSSFSYFIVGRAAQEAAKDILGIEAAALTTSATVQRSFADIERTFDGTHSQLVAIETQLYAMSTIDPVSITDLASIASLGNQLGIAQENIISFTQAIAEYSTISGQSAEDAATAFGKISALTGLAASEYSNLGSAIEYVARTSVSTEAGIQNTAEEITAIASGAGFSADAIVGLSGALASLSIPPERARGALSLYFGALNTAVAQGGPKLQEFATLTGLTTTKIAELVQANKGQDVFTAFLKGLSNLNSVAKTTALDALGLSTIRVDQTMRALSQNVPLVTSSLEGANTAFTRNTELAHQYAIIQKTLSSGWKEFQNAIQDAFAQTGDIFNTSTLLSFVDALKQLITGFRTVADSPVGQVVLGIAATFAALLAVALGLVGTLAFVTAGMKLIPWALTGLGAEDASKGLFQFLAGLVGINLTAKEENGVMVSSATSMRSVGAAAEGAALKMGLLDIALAEGTITEAEYAVEQKAIQASIIATGVATDAASLGFKTLKIAMATTGIGLAVVLISSLVTALVEAGTASESAADKAKDFFGTSVDLSSAFKQDQTVYDSTGKAIAQIGTNVESSKTSADAWVNSLQKATGAQVALGDGTTKTTKNIVDQTEAYGANAQAALAKALADSKTFQNLFKDTAANAELAKAGFNGTDFAATLLGGNPGKDGKAYVDALTTSISSEYGLQKGQLATLLAELPDAVFNNSHGSAVAQGKLGEILQSQNIDLSKDQLNALITLKPAYDSLNGAVDSASSRLKAGAQAAAAQTAAQKGLAAAAAGAGSGFVGEVDDMTALQDAMQSGLAKFVDFDTILTTVQGKLKTPLDVNATAFNAGLATANQNAITFFNGVNQLAKNGDTSLAQQLATIGPDASGVLASSLKLTPDAQNQLEENARFAAFIASDAFKKAITTDSQNDNAAYAQILSGGGSLADVQSFITAQVTGVGDAYEKAWDLNHPNFPLAVDLVAPTSSEVQLFKDQTAGLLTVTAQVIPTYDPSKPYADVNKYLNTKTGATIELPASLSGDALSTSLEYWKTHAGASATTIDAKLNSGTLGDSLKDFVKKQGPISVGITYKVATENPNIKPTTKPVSIPGELTTAAMTQELEHWRSALGPQKVPATLSTATFEKDVDTWAKNHVFNINAKMNVTSTSVKGTQQAKGGPAGGWDNAPHFAAGGSPWGPISGPGTGTSDSIPTWLSMGEWVTPNDATSFWGPDFMSAIGRKMLPASFVNMLGAAAGAGQSGPTHVANVQVHQHNPVTRDPLKQLRQDSENVAAGIWGD